MYIGTQASITHKVYRYQKLKQTPFPLSLQENWGVERESRLTWDGRNWYLGGGGEGEGEINSREVMGSGEEGRGRERPRQGGRRPDGWMQVGCGTM